MPTWRHKAFAIFFRRKFRPWALLTPILVLLVALPLLRPLRAPAGASLGERLLLDTVRAISTRGGMKLDAAVWRGQPGTIALPAKGVYADRPPVFAVMLAAPAWLMQKAGLKYGVDDDLIAYLLTVVGTTIPVAIGGGVIYRMGRLFELPRRRRALLALLVTFGGGWISYATVLNPHATAAAAVTCSAACLLYLAAARRTGQVLAILVLAGLLAATAAALSPWALPLVVPLPLVLFATALPARQKVVGFVLMTLGAMPIAWVHAAWSLDAYGSVLSPGSVRTLDEVFGGDAGRRPTDPDAVEGAAGGRLGPFASTLLTVTLGRHGLFSHFPIVLASLAGLLIVLRKHWPMHAKVLGAITLAGSMTIVLMVASRRGDGPVGGGGVGPWMFAVQWFVVFLPLATFWLGAVLRRALDRRLFWAVAAACVVSVVVSLNGARGPLAGGM